MLATGTLKSANICVQVKSFLKMCFLEETDDTAKHSDATGGLLEEEDFDEVQLSLSGFSVDSIWW